MFINPNYVVYKIDSEDCRFIKELWNKANMIIHGNFIAIAKSDDASAGLRKIIKELEFATILQKASHEEQNAFWKEIQR